MCILFRKERATKDATEAQPKRQRLSAASQRRVEVVRCRSSDDGDRAAGSDFQRERRPKSMTTLSDLYGNSARINMHDLKNIDTRIIQYE